MVGLIDAHSPEVYKLLTANKLSDTSPISAEMWTEHFQFRLCNHKRALLTCYLEDPTNLHGIIYSVTSYDLDKFLLLTLQFHPALVAGTGAWTLPFNAAISKHLYTNNPPYSGFHCPEKHFKHECAVQPRFRSVLYFFHQARREKNSRWSW